ncbi:MULTISPECIES: single-stranded DNA-binding protein [unclassified Mycoplasma]|uniref:single-stranded DNA-binding protein n=1 Tax=unclassified Mycoplasma TaxID=2683645 RepID=UPI00211BB193|nr:MULTISPECIES: single-stranded DNA-binding protein [unclassified Mycoplasma]UUM20071.1 single-stranded DNA-binding protein [Mycoplasma sp. 1578d]UUM25051.1 single-stranded DNA-binding protein [Mycoplasma sp. 3686d]
MNKVMLLGRISSAIFYGKTMNRVDHARFWIAVSNKGQSSDFVPIICWNQTASFVRDYLTKGSLIYIEGEIIPVKYFAEYKQNINSAFVIQVQNLKAFSFKDQNSIRPIFLNVDVVDPQLHDFFDLHLQNNQADSQPFIIPNGKN